MVWTGIRSDRHGIPGGVGIRVVLAGTRVLTRCHSWQAWSDRVSLYSLGFLLLVVRIESRTILNSVLYLYSRIRISSPSSIPKNQLDNCKSIARSYQRHFRRHNVPLFLTIQAPPTAVRRRGHLRSTTRLTTLSPPWPPWKSILH